MSHLRTLFSALLGPIFFCTACIADKFDQINENVAESGAEVNGNKDHSRIVTNGLSAAYLLSSRDALIDLSARELSPAAIAGSPLMEEAEGRSLLGYVIKCALGWDEQLKIPYGGVSIIFEGGVGLAETWASDALSASGQRWMTACLLAHSNAYGIRVPLSLRGDHPGLATTTEEVQTYTIEEGAYYGDLFARGTKEPEILACWGKSAEDPCAASQSKWLADRVCALGSASESACGFFVAGACYESKRGGFRACSKSDENGYHDCYPTTGETSLSASLERDGRGTGYAEVITVFLKVDPKAMMPIECAGP